MNQVPEQYREQWNKTNAELHEASCEVVQANERYHRAILARLALRELIRSEYGE